MLMFVLSIVVMIVSYLLGSIPVGLLLTKYMANVDITKVGSGNIGATNVLRICGKKLGLITLILDALKGIIAVTIASVIGGIGLKSLAALCVVSGHIFPYWLNFKGGKGVATSAGALLVLYYPIFIMSALIWGGVFYFTRIVSLASIAAAVISLPFAWVYSPTYFSAFVTTIISTLVVIRHKDNIIRLLKGEEKPVSSHSDKL